VRDGGSKEFPITVCTVYTISRDCSKSEEFKTFGKGHGNEVEAVSLMVQLFRRGYYKSERMLGGPETVERYWVRFPDLCNFQHSWQILLYYYYNVK
jgi:hypothetical protein